MKFDNSIKLSLGVCLFELDFGSIVRKRYPYAIAVCVRNTWNRHNFAYFCVLSSIVTHKDINKYVSIVHLRVFDCIDRLHPFLANHLNVNAILIENKSSESGDWNHELLSPFISFPSYGSPHSHLAHTQKANRQFMVKRHSLKEINSSRWPCSGVLLLLLLLRLLLLLWFFLFFKTKRK